MPCTYRLSINNYLVMLMYNSFLGFLYFSSCAIWQKKSGRIRLTPDTHRGMAISLNTGISSCRQKDEIKQHSLTKQKTFNALLHNL